MHIYIYIYREREREKLKNKVIQRECNVKESQHFGSNELLSGLRQDNIE